MSPPERGRGPGRKGDPAAGNGNTDDIQHRKLAIGLVFGSGIGTALGAALDNVGVGVALGSTFGAVLGALFERLSTEKAQDPEPPGGR